MLSGKVANELRAQVLAAVNGEKTRDEVLRSIDTKVLSAALRPSLPSIESLQAQGHAHIARGVAASAGVGSGAIVFRAEEVLELAKEGRAAILVRSETSAEDVHAIRAAHAVLTASGGLTSHAAVMARGIGRACVVGCDALRIDEKTRTLTVTHPDTRAVIASYSQGDVITVDGSTGNVFSGSIQAVPAAHFDELRTVLDWADERRSLRVLANASTTTEVESALRAGTDGIGLCRLEQLLSAPAAINLLRVVVFGSDEAVRGAASAEIGKLIEHELRAMYALCPNISVRLFDGTANELAPTTAHDAAALATSLGITAQSIPGLISDRREKWPLFGARGVRMLATHESFAHAQVQAIERASASAGVTARILVPMVAFAEEVQFIRSLMTSTSELGAMLETPRSCLIARDIAKHASFLAFGTNDLTQATLAMGRDDAHAWLGAYKRMQPAPVTFDPFRTLDRMGVGALMQLAVAEARAVRKDVDVYMCGEHGAEEGSIAFAASIGLNGVSCGPASVPGARLAAGKVAAGTAG